jgi:hypothetical protein
VFGDAVLASRRDDDGPARLDDLSGGAHPFDRLVQIQVKWVA